MHYKELPEFEYDLEKSRRNASKHGIDFMEAQQLWLDKNLCYARSPGFDELRYLGFGKIRETHWTVIFTLRGTKVRLISTRRSRKGEKKIYEYNKQRQS